MANAANISVNGNGLEKVKEAALFFARHRVLVGIPAAQSSRKGALNNAELMFIHTHGSPINHIPPRPVIEPAIQQPDVMEKVTKCLMASAEQAIAGNDSGAMAELEKAGIYASNAAKDYFGSDNLAPNSEATIAKKGSSAPLIDTGSLRSSVTYIVE